jgi:NADPH:quinone reductase-like Zn-dependent oxidoreductase
MVNERYVLVSARGRRRLQWMREPMPRAEAGEVRVRILAAGVAFADLLRMRGLYPGDPALPFSPGWDLAGEIDQVGAGVTAWRVGQPVVALTGYGNYTRYRTLQADDLVAMPEETEPAEAVCLCLNYVTAYQLLHRMAKARQGETVLVHGAAGGVGTALLQLGALAGLKLYGVASKPHLATVTGLGGVAIDRQTEDFVRRVRALPGGGVDVALDPIGGATALRSFRALRAGGRLVSYGLSGLLNLPRYAVPLAYLTHFARLMLWNLLPGRRRARFYSIGSMRARRPLWIREDLTLLLDLLRRRRIAPLIAERLPLARAPEALERLAQGQVQGKLVLMCQE